MDKQKIKQIAGTVLNVLIWIFVAFSILTTVLVFSAQGSEDGVPAIFGKSLITIQSDSMKDEFKKGDLIIMTKLSDEEKLELKKDDIITFRADLNGDGKPELNTHRVYEVTEGSLSLRTNGDNVPGPDPEPVHHSDIIGIYKGAKLTGLGSVIDFLGSSLGFFLCIVLPLILFFLYELYNFISLLIVERAKKATTENISKETEEDIKKRAIEEYLKAQALANSAAQEEKTEENAKNDNENNTDNQKSETK